MYSFFNNNNIFFHLPPTSNHLYLLQAKNCDSNSRLVVDEDDNSKFRLERVICSQVLAMALVSASIIVEGMVSVPSCQYYQGRAKISDIGGQEVTFRKNMGVSGASSP